jgi:hypothetical protein
MSLHFHVGVDRETHVALELYLYVSFHLLVAKLSEGMPLSNNSYMLIVVQEWNKHIQDKIKATF